MTRLHKNYLIIFIFILFLFLFLFLYKNKSNVIEIHSPMQIRNYAFGFSISSDNQRLAVSALGNNGFRDIKSNYGSVYILEQINNTWKPSVLIKPNESDGSDLFGYSIILRDNLLIVGAPRKANTIKQETGAVYEFQKINNIWTQKSILQPINGEINEEFGYSLAMSEDNNTLFIGAPHKPQLSNNALDTGAVYIFQRTGATWSQKSIIYKNIPSINDKFGSSIALEDSVLAIGSPGSVHLDESGESPAKIKGSVEIFNLINHDWIYQSTINPPIDQFEYNVAFGFIIKLQQNHLIIGSPQEVDNSAQSHGRVYIMEHIDDEWKKTSTFNTNNPGDGGDFFGRLLDFDGNSLIIAQSSSELLVVNCHKTCTNNYTLFFNTNNTQPITSIARAGDHIIVGSPYANGKTENEGLIFILQDQ